MTIIQYNDKRPITVDLNFCFRIVIGNDIYLNDSKVAYYTPDNKYISDFKVTIEE